MKYAVSGRSGLRHFLLRGARLRLLVPVQSERGRERGLSLSCGSFPFEWMILSLSITLYWLTRDTGPSYNLMQFCTSAMTFGHLWHTSFGWRDFHCSVCIPQSSQAPRHLWQDLLSVFWVSYFNLPPGGFPADELSMGLQKKPFQGHLHDTMMPQTFLHELSWDIFIKLFRSNSINFLTNRR